MILKDNSSYAPSDFDEIPKLTKKLLDKTLKDLEKENIFVFPDLIDDIEDLEGNQKVLFRNNQSYSTSNLMGFLGLENEQLVIRSRFSSENDDYFMQYMLNKVIDIPNIMDLRSEANSETKLFDLLMFLFPLYLKQALRKGLYKTYVSYLQNDSSIKGPIDVERHIKLNTPFTGEIAYRQRLMSNDNALMELIRHTIEYIKVKSFGMKIIRKVKDEVRLVVDATSGYARQERIKVLNQNKKQRVRHAYFHEYRSLQQLCIMILGREKLQMGNSGKQVYGIIFDGAWLWEEYVNTLIKDQFYHPKNKSSKGKQQLFSLDIGKRGSIYPDFISRKTECRMIADAKYKPIANIYGSDYLQLLAYMFRFDAKKGIYIYPEHLEKQKEEFWLNSGTTFESNVVPREDIKVIKLGIDIPKQVEGYDDFTNKMHQNEVKFLQSMQEYADEHIDF